MQRKREDAWDIVADKRKDFWVRTSVRRGVDEGLPEVKHPTHDVGLKWRIMMSEKCSGVRECYEKKRTYLVLWRIVETLIYVILSCDVFRIM
ncbi:hypothetical protein MLD38_040660 [Melastoma candidum]|nr:hypothetical protein MLD38_040660 [Melastoma candidum]